MKHRSPGMLAPIADLFTNAGRIAVALTILSGMILVGLFYTAVNVAIMALCMVIYLLKSLGRYAPARGAVSTT